jgi:hypothetical protein
VESSDVESAMPTNGPLRVSAQNPRYFEDADGNTVLLAGAHTWLNIQDTRPSFIPGEDFDFDRYLDLLRSNGHTYTRLWVWEQGSGIAGVSDDARFTPTIYARTGPGRALDGGARFDLERFDDEYFHRLRARVDAAREQGVYVSVMLFNGWSLDDKGEDTGNPCLGHPYNGANNVNGVDADVDDDGYCDEAHRLEVAAVTSYQEAYVEKVVDTVGDLDNVLFEISNESPAGSHEWQYHMIEHLRGVLGERGLDRPIGMTVEWPDGDNTVLFTSPAEWVSPNDQGGYRDDPPPADGSKVSVLDTDHLWGVGGDRGWVWKSVTRGHNLAYMDCDELCTGAPGEAARDEVILNMGAAVWLTSQMDLATARPDTTVTSTGYALVSDLGELLVYLPDGGSATVELASSGRFLVTWLDPVTGEVMEPVALDGEGAMTLVSPFANDAVVLLRSIPPS